MSTPARPAVSSQQSAVSIGVIVNGDSRSVPSGSTLLDLIRELGLRQELVAVEINRELVPKRTFADRQLRDGDHIEIVEFVGGG